MTFSSCTHSLHLVAVAFAFREQVTVSFFGLEGERSKPFTFFIASLCGDNSLSHAFTARVSFTKWLPFLHCSSEQLDKKKKRQILDDLFFIYLLFWFVLFLFGKFLRKSSVYRVKSHNFRCIKKLQRVSKMNVCKKTKVCSDVWYFQPVSFFSKALTRENAVSCKIPQIEKDKRWSFCRSRIVYIVKFPQFVPP